jgi:hypothetical protein
MRKRKTSATALEREYMNGGEPTWTGFFGRASARVCLEPHCGHIAYSDERSCPRCGGWEMARLTRRRAA